MMLKPSVILILITLFYIAHSFENILDVSENLRLTRTGSSYFSLVFQDRKSSGNKLIILFINGGTHDALYHLAFDNEMVPIEARTYYNVSSTRITICGYDNNYFYIHMVRIYIFIK